MKNYGFFRVAACSPLVKPADIAFNVEQIKSETRKCIECNVDVVVFPELCITGYTCGDLFDQYLIIEEALEATIDVAIAFKDDPITIIVGLPIGKDRLVFNCAAVLSKGKIQGIVPKTYLPNYGEFYEKRWFASGINFTGNLKIASERHDVKYKVPFGTDLLFSINDTIAGVEICEDLWTTIPPSSLQAINGALLIFNLSATNELSGKYDYLCKLISHQSARCKCVYTYASAGTGESSTDLAFAGNCIIAENGKIIKRSDRFTLESKLAMADVDLEKLIYDRRHSDTFHTSNLRRECRIIAIDTANNYDRQRIGSLADVSVNPFKEIEPQSFNQQCEEITSIQAWGIAMRLRAIGCKKAIIGVSGGLDSTLALLVTVKAFNLLGLPLKGIIALSMPGFGTTERTKTNADSLMDLLGVSHKIIPISKSVSHHFEDIGHDGSVRDATYENSQARMRTMVLMDTANKEGGIVVGTGDLSELALGWCTYNGDQMSMYGVNASIPKTLVRHLVRYFADISDNPKLREVLYDIIDTPISPELLPPDDEDKIEQKTEDLVGPYELHDFFLYYALRYGFSPEKIRFLSQRAFKDKYPKEIIDHWLKVFYKRFFNQQFKRSVMPDGVKATCLSLSPRGDWRMPSDASSSLFIN